MFNDNGNIKPGKDLEIEFHLKDTHKICCLQIIDALPKTWKDIILKDTGNTKNLVKNIVRKSHICTLNKLTSKSKIYFLIRNTTLNTKACMFQYKVLHNILYVNKMFFKFGKATTSRCSFCKLHDETIMHLFYNCLIVKRFWNQLKSMLSNNLIFPISTPQSAIF